MIGPGARAKVIVATRPVDFRKGPDALAALVGVEYGGDPYSGVIYVFQAKRSHLPTFGIHFAPRYDRVSVAPSLRD
ncbi:IS66 family insertion sequence element accessory protein TnpB [Novosphingobium sp. BL-52-GroH]|uniref:IS66 family insertion sequence element accessory protein TnpB n=1 Tax=Novosphingobium sp. BL-52-GroH TaxID=3349877 RepID=UPI00384F02D5